MAMTLNIGRRRAYQNIPVESLAYASEYFTNVRDGLGEGASTFPDGLILEDGRPVGRISYNGRVWPPHNHGPSDTPLYDPRAPR